MKCIFFDIDNTLFNTEELVENARKKAAEAMVHAGLPGTEDEVYKKILEIVEKLGSNHSKHYDELIKEYEVQMEGKIIAAGVAAYHDYKFENIKPFGGVSELLKRLEKYTLAVITNGLLVKQWEKLIRLGLENNFEFSRYNLGKPYYYCSWQQRLKQKGNK